jgi:hypothetical protein
MPEAIDPPSLWLANSRAGLRWRSSSQTLCICDYELLPNARSGDLRTLSWLDDSSVAGIGIRPAVPCVYGSTTARQRQQVRRARWSAATARRCRHSGVRKLFADSYLEHCCHASTTVTGVWPGAPRPPRRDRRIHERAGTASAEMSGTTRVDGIEEGHWASLGRALLRHVCAEEARVHGRAFQQTETVVSGTEVLVEAREQVCAPRTGR